MSTEQTSTQKPRFIRPPNILKQKVGFGGIDEKLLEQSQHLIDNTELDFTPYAKDYLEALSQAIQEVKVGSFSIEEARDKVIKPVMQLKANGGMFRYQLISEIADIALQFLESVDVINDDSIDVLKAHQKTMDIIIHNKLKGSGGKEGYALVKELDGACKRYFSRHKQDKQEKKAK